MSATRLLSGASSLAARPKTVLLAAIIVAGVIWGLTFYWSMPPDMAKPREVAARMAPEDTDPTSIRGYTTAATLVHVTETILNKSGGYMSNDLMPPFVLMDNMPAWEYGVVRQIRDLAASMRNAMSRSRSTSDEDPDLARAEPQFNFATNSWIFPATEGEYRKGIRHMKSYMARLRDAGDTKAQFYARADNLADYLGLVNKRLGNLSQRLSASVGSYRVNTDLEADPSARQTKVGEDEVYTETGWFQVDNVYYEARGSTWAIIQFLHAIKVDFREVLKDKNALVSLRQLIRDLEHAQRTMYSPVVLNGHPYGVFANHSLILASYISRANAAVIELRDILSRG